jgi:hypothetical protein
MDASQIMWIVEAIFMMSMSVVFLWLQARALARYKHHSFLMLVLGSVFGVVYLIASFSIGFFAVESSRYALVTMCCSILSFISFILSMVGTVQLFRSYGELTDKVRELEIAATR